MRRPRRPRRPAPSQEARGAPGANVAHLCPAPAAARGRNRSIARRSATPTRGTLSVIQPLSANALRTPWMMRHSPLGPTGKASLGPTSTLDPMPCGVVQGTGKLASRLLLRLGAVRLLSSPQQLSTRAAISAAAAPYRQQRTHARTVQSSNRTKHARGIYAALMAALAPCGECVGPKRRGGQSISLMLHSRWDILPIVSRQLVLRRRRRRHASHATVL